jgi:subtilisin-like proprotein convertase family protein
MVGSAALIFTLLNASGAPFVFSNTNVISLGENDYPPSPATPYLSTVNVAGYPGARLIKATATFHNLTHTFPSDISVLLVGPQGQRTILMSQTGGQNRYSVTNLTLTLDDDATNSLPVFTGLTSGVFRPTDGYLLLGYPRFPYDFPPPAPSGNSNAISSLAVFQNTDPNGVWSLFIVDDSTGDTGSVAGGWSLSLSLGTELQIAHMQTNVVLSWPDWATNCLLQLSPGPAPNSWTNATAQPARAYGWFVLTNPVSGPGTLFRLVGH